MDAVGHYSPNFKFIRLFDLPGVNQSNARFDDKKLAHMNLTYLLEQPADRFVVLARALLERAGAKAALAADPAYLREVLLISQPKIKSLEEIPAYTAWFFTEDYPIDPKVREKVMGKGDSKARLTELIAALPGFDFTNDSAIEQGLAALAANQLERARRVVADTGFVSRQAKGAGQGCQGIGVVVNDQEMGRIVIRRWTFCRCLRHRHSSSTVVVGLRICARNLRTQARASGPRPSSARAGAGEALGESATWNSCANEGISLPDGR